MEAKKTVSEPKRPKSAAIAALVCLVGFASQAYAVPLVSWSISGPGSTTATENAPGDWDLSYNLNPAGFSTVAWNVSATAPAAGNYEFDWTYSGLHAWFMVTAFLTTSDGTTLYSAGPQNCCTTPSDGFSVSGNYVFAGISTGDVFGFTMGGSNFDINNFLTGTLNLVQVPEPTTLALLCLGLIGIGASRRRAGFNRA